MRGTDCDMPRLRASQVQAAADQLGLRIAPAITGGLLAYAHSRALGQALLLALAMLAMAHLLDCTRYPKHLMPGARCILAAGGPLLGGVAAVAVSGVAGARVSPMSVAVAVSGAWAIMAVGAVVSELLKRHRPRRIAVIGRPEFAHSLARELSSGGIAGYQIVGWIGPPASPSSFASDWLGTLANVRTAVLDNAVELLVCAPEASAAPGEDVGAQEGSLAVYQQIAGGCLDLPVRMIDASQFYENLLGHVPMGTIDAAWFRYIMHPRYRASSPLSKRALDLALGSVAAVLALPLVAIAAVAIKLSDGGPILHRQRRMGEHGSEFEILKLRSMRVDAESHGAPRWSSADDDRVTAVGRLLRRTHVDELPQLINVLRGEMTLVGPRPERPELVNALERQFPHYERRHLVKPGITGWAQVRCGYAGTEAGTAWKLCHDLYYLKHRSVLADLMLMVETAVIAPRDSHRTLRAPERQFLVSELPST